MNHTDLVWLPGHTPGSITSSGMAHSVEAAQVCSNEHIL